MIDTPLIVAIIFTVINAVVAIIYMVKYHRLKTFILALLDELQINHPAYKYIDIIVRRAKLR